MCARGPSSSLGRRNPFFARWRVNLSFWKHEIFIFDEVVARSVVVGAGWDPMTLRGRLRGLGSRPNVLNSYLHCYNRVLIIKVKTIEFRHNYLRTTCRRGTGETHVTRSLGEPMLAAPAYGTCHARQHSYTTELARSRLSRILSGLAESTDTRIEAQGI